MRVFVSEYVTTCDWPQSHEKVPLPAEQNQFARSPHPAASLVHEGLSMLAAIVVDLARIPGVEIHATRSCLLDGFDLGTACRIACERFAGGEMVFAQSKFETGQLSDHIVWHSTSGSNSEREMIERLSAESGAALIIAPEFRGLLTERCRWVEQRNARLLGPSSAAVEICADKFALCQRLQLAGVSTIDTFEFDVEQPAADLPFPVVIKPRDGAGSLVTYVLLHRVHLAWQLPRLREESLLRNAVWQPFVAGRALSVGVLVSPETGRAAEALPVCDQILSGDGRLKYFGGRVPADCSRAAEVQQIALAACEQVPGLRGYVGVDMLLPDDPRSPPLVVEINPRLTTSYLGYQSLCLDNLAERILFPDRDRPPLRWRDRQVTFAPHGFAVPNMD
jgi:predicted ATP-grasp superfamily ATP-dependent carboligase